MIHIDAELGRHAFDPVHFVKAYFKEAITSLAAFNMVFGQLAASLLKTSTLLTNQFPIATSVNSLYSFDWDNVSTDVG